MHKAMCMKEWLIANLESMGFVFVQLAGEIWYISDGIKIIKEMETGCQSVEKIYQLWNQDGTKKIKH